MCVWPRIYPIGVSQEVKAMTVAKQEGSGENYGLKLKCCYQVQAYIAVVHTAVDFFS